MGPNVHSAGQGCVKQAASVQSLGDSLLGLFLPTSKKAADEVFCTPPFSRFCHARVQCDHQRWVLLGTTFPTSCRSTKCNQRRRFSANLRTCTVQIRTFKCCVELRVSVNRNQFLSQLDHHFKQYE